MRGDTISRHSCLHLIVISRESPRKRNSHVVCGTIFLLRIRTTSIRNQRTTFLPRFLTPSVQSVTHFSYSILGMHPFRLREVGVFGRFTVRYVRARSVRARSARMPLISLVEYHSNINTEHQTRYDRNSRKTSRLFRLMDAGVLENLVSNFHHCQRVQYCRTSFVLSDDKKRIDQTIRDSVGFLRVNKI